MPSLASDYTIFLPIDVVKTNCALTEFQSIDKGRLSQSIYLLHNFVSTFNPQLSVVCRIDKFQ